MNTCIRSKSGRGAALLLALGLAAPAWAARDGQLDPSFGNQGKAILPFPGDLFLRYTGLVDLAALPNGQMIAAGTVINSAGDNDFAAIRLNADGTLDTSYGSSGGRRIGFDQANGTLSDILIGLLLQPDGKAVLAGIAAGDPAVGGSDMAVVRLTTAGNLDSTFGTGGRALVPFNLGPVGQREEQGTRLALQSDGKLLLVGTADDAQGDLAMALVRLNTNGQRDTTFDGDGRVTVEFGPDYGSSNGLQVRQLADGKILAVGVALRTLPGNISSADFAMAKFNANGSLDNGFGVGGTTTFDFAVGGNFRDYAYDFQELPDGRLLVCGHAEVNAPLNTDMACVRLLADGTPDPAFAAVLVPFDRGGNLQDVVVRMARDGQGRILLAGQVARAASNNDFGVARLLPDGNLDPSFGNGGTVTHNSCITICVPAEFDNISTTLLLQADGKIVLGGFVANSAGDYRFMFARLFGDVIFSHGFEP